MRRVLPFILVAGLAAAFTGASAQTTPAAGTTSPAAATTPAPANAATTPAQNNDDIVSCRYEKTTGSLFSKRVCHTQREWHQMSEDARDTMDRIDAHSNSGGPVGGN